MTRGLSALALTGLLFALHAAWLALAGGAAPQVMDLWGEAIAAAEGATPIGRIATSFPPLPLLFSTGWELTLGHTGLPSPLGAAAALAAGLGGLWWIGFRNAGLGRASALVAALLMALNPVMLWLVAEGPGPVLVAGALWVLAVGLSRLRRRGAAPDAALVAFALAVLAVSDDSGFLFALAALPFVALAAPPDLLGRAPLGLLLILFFPLLAWLLGAAFIGFVFGNDGLGAGAILPSLASAADSARLALPAALLAAAATAPVLFAFPVAARGMAPLRILGLALAGFALGGIVLAASAGTVAAGLGMVAPVLALGAAAGALLIRDAARPRLVLALLAVGAVGGGATLWIAPEIGAARLRAALAGAAPGAAREDMQRLAEAIAGREDVMVDIYAAPALVALRGSTAGLVGPADPRFHLAAISRRPDAALVAVRATDAAGAPPDRVAVAFPQFHAGGIPGYVLAQEIGPWRLFERMMASAAPEDRN